MSVGLSVIFWLCIVSNLVSYFIYCQSRCTVSNCRFIKKTLIKSISTSSSTLILFRLKEVFFSGSNEPPAPPIPDRNFDADDDASSAAAATAAAAAASQEQESQEQEEQEDEEKVRSIKKVLVVTRAVF